MNSRIEPRRVVEFVLYALTLLESVGDAMCPVIGKFLFAEDAEWRFILTIFGQYFYKNLTLRENIFLGIYKKIPLSEINNYKIAKNIC